MQNLLKYSRYFVLILIVSCTKEEVPHGTTTPKIEKLTIITDIDYRYWGTSGTSGYFNDSLYSFGYSDYSKAFSNGLFGSAFRKGEWYEDVLWADREVNSW